MFNKISDDIAAKLKAAAGEQYVLMGDAIGADFSHDEKALYGANAPEAVVYATSTEQVAAILKVCNENNVPVTPRGAGTGLVGGSVPVEGGVVLCTGKMDKIVSYDEEAMTVTVQPGVLLSDLTADAAGKGFLYAPDPGEKTATVGGNVSTNAGGPMAVKYGSTRDSVLNLTAVLPTGEIVKLGCDVSKDNSGYSLMHLVIGSEGTLAVVTEMTLKLNPAPKASLGFILPFSDMETCIAAAAMLKKSGLNPDTLEFMDKEIVKLSTDFTGVPVFPLDAGGEPVEALLLTEFTGESDEELEVLMEKFAELTEESGCLDILVIDNPTLRKSVKEAHDAFHTSVESAAKLCDEANSAVPTAKLAEYLAFAKEQAAANGLTMQNFGHAGDGNAHIYVYNDELAEADFRAAAKTFMDALYAKCAEMGGSVSAEHGVGRGKAGYLAEASGEAKMRVMRGIKAAFDPNGILNPGKIC